MGYRTTVILYNDYAGDWVKDPALGGTISRCMNHVGDPFRGAFHGGVVVECVHADTATLALVDSYSFKPLAYDMWSPKQDSDAQALLLLRAAADKLGYKLIKKSTR